MRKTLIAAGLAAATSLALGLYALHAQVAHGQAEDFAGTTVIGIQGIPVVPVSPAAGQVLMFDPSSSRYVPESPSGGQYKIGTLPPCDASVVGRKLIVTDGESTPTYLGAVSTTGSVVAPVMCNGSGWVYD